jgi:hypothetical protein
MHQPYPLTQQWSRSWPNSGTSASLPAGFSAWNLLLSPPLVQIGRWRPAFLQIEVRHDRTENPGRDESGRRTLVAGGPRAAAEGAQDAGCNGARPTCVVWRRAGGRRVSGAGRLCAFIIQIAYIYSIPKPDCFTATPRPLPRSTCSVLGSRFFWTSVFQGGGFWRLAFSAGGF